MTEPIKTAHAESKSAFNRRVNAEGRWKEFEARREQLKRDGVAVNLAWKVVAYFFPPLDGKPHEIQFTEQVIMLAIANAEKMGFKRPEIEGFNALAPSTSGIPEPPEAPKTANGAWTLFSQGVHETIEDYSKRWRALAEEVDAARKAGAGEYVDWIYENAGTPPELIDPDAVPSVGALRHLMLVQGSEKEYANFVEKLWSRRIPDKRTMGFESQLSDDGREQLAYLAEFEREFHKQEEPAVA